MWFIGGVNTIMIQAVCFPPMPVHTRYNLLNVFFCFHIGCTKFLLKCWHENILHDTFTAVPCHLLTLLTGFCVEYEWIFYRLLRTFLQLVQILLQFFHDDAWYLLFWHSALNPWNMYCLSLDSSACMHPSPCVPARKFWALTLGFPIGVCFWSNLNLRPQLQRSAVWVNSIVLLFFAVFFNHTVLCNSSRYAAMGPSSLVVICLFNFLRFCRNSGLTYRFPFE